MTEVLKLMGGYEHIDPSVLQKAAERGSAVHEAIAGSISCKDLPIQWHGYYEAYVEWHEVAEPDYVFQEKRLYDDDLMITGQMDAVARIQDKLILLDWKTSNKPSPSWDIQMNAYMRMLQKIGHSVHEAWIVLLSRMGRYQVIKVPYQAQLWHEFLSLLSMYREMYGAKEAKEVEREVRREDVGRQTLDLDTPTTLGDGQE